MALSNIGKNPLDKIADIAGALAIGKKKAEKKKKIIQKKIKDATPAKIAGKVADAAASKIGVTRGTCKHKGTKRGTVCDGCGSKIL